SASSPASTARPHADSRMTGSRKAVSSLVSSCLLCTSAFRRAPKRTRKRERAKTRRGKGKTACQEAEKPGRHEFLFLISWFPDSSFGLRVFALSRFRVLFRRCRALPKRGSPACL